MSAQVESQSDGRLKTRVNHEDIVLSKEIDSDDDDYMIEITQKDVPSTMFGGLIRKRDKNGEVLKR